MKIVKYTSLLAILFFFSASQRSYGQNGVAIAGGASVADNSAMLDVQSTSKGVLIPRMSSSNRLGISNPATGLLVYDNTVNYYYYNAGTPSVPNWVILNGGAVSTIGGTTNYDAVFTASTAIGTGLIYESSPYVGIGTTTSANTLTVNNAGTTVATIGTFPFAIGRANSVDFTIGSDASNAYLQSWNNKPLVINYDGNNVGIGAVTPTAQLHTTGTVRFQNYASGILCVDATGLFTVARTITGTANQIDLTNGNGVSGNPTAAMDPAYAMELKSNFVMTGGGTVAWTGSVLSWTARFIVMGDGMGTSFGSSGYLNIYMPTSGTITGVGGAANVTATASGVPLGSWQALYYVMTVGQATDASANAANYRVTYFSANYTVPENWILIAVENDDDHVLRLGNGMYIASGSAVSETAGSIPVGTIQAYGGTTAPAGWLICDGTSYTRTTYPALYAVIANNFGTASGTTFNVPDLRGRFIRGWDNGASNDPDHAARTALNTGGNTGNAVGSYQADMIITHQHQFGADDQVGPQGGYTTLSNFSYDATSNANGSGVNLQTKSSANYTMGDQTHPRNVYTQYIIKY